MMRRYSRKKSSIALILVVAVVVCVSDGATLVREEASALHAIAKELGKKDWNFSVDPCKNDARGSWRSEMDRNNPNYLNQLNCTCSQSHCHVSAIVLKGQDLAGVLPKSLAKLPHLQRIDFTRNYLHGSVPQEWTSLHSLDYLNVFRSSSRDLNSPLAVCLEKLPFSEYHYSLDIDCGGSGTKVGKTYYEADNNNSSPAKFNSSKAEWGYSSTGYFLSISYNGSFIVTNDTVLPVKNANLYTHARISPISLTYYGRCLAKGKYTVVLYFAELRFTNNNSFHRLGRRLFDIYIQEKLVMSNFDIVSTAGGAEKTCNVTANGVSVTEASTIEIRLYYAGKGTTGVPIRGTYGPLISAISVKSEFKPPLSKKTIIEISVGSASVLLMAFIGYCTYVWWRRERSFPSREEGDQDS